MNQTLQDLMRSATRLTQSGRLSEATEVIQRALSGTAAAARAAAGHAVAEASPLVLDGCVFEMPAAAPAPAPVAAPAAAAAAAAASASGARAAGSGAFTGGTHSHAGLTRAYKLFVPHGRADRARALVVMLHGCTQDPDDFAAGTGMNDFALDQDFIVLYPAQSHDANPSRCWNWFKHNHQRRGSGEPAVIASMTREVMKQHGIDPRRVFVAGLSAGGAMASIVAQVYPEIFAAAGVHSGLPPGAASSVPEALSVMNIGVAGGGARAGSRSVDPTPAVHVPTIVFHGDQDRTVHPRNGEQVIKAALGRAAAGATRVQQGRSGQGRRYTRSVHVGDRGDTLAEHWLLHGAGHAWSGGQAAGSYTDGAGPDATREMLRFFMEHPLAAERA